MTPEIEKHLQKVEAAIQAAKRLLSRHAYPDDLRTVIVIGFIDQMIEHHEAMLSLIRSGKTGSAFALARSIFESMYRGLWINFCASDSQVRRFERKDRLPKMEAMARSIDQRYRGRGFFSDLKKRGWGALCGYTHTGLIQLGRRFTGHNIEPAYRDGEIAEITTAVTTCLLVLVSKFLAVQKYADESREAERLIETYGPAAAQAAVASAPTPKGQTVKDVPDSCSQARAGRDEL